MRRSKGAVDRGTRSLSTIFPREVGRCAGELHRTILLLCVRFSAPALATALAIHAVRALSRCVEREEITAEHARALIERMAELRLPRIRRRRR